MNRFIFTSALICMFAFTACKKESNDPVVVSVSIVEPVAADTIAAGADLHMEGSMSSNSTMHGYTLTLINTLNDSILFSYAGSNHSDSYSFHQHWENTLTDTTQVKFKLHIEKGHNGEIETREVNVVCLP